MRHLVKRALVLLSAGCAMWQMQGAARGDFVLTDKSDANGVLIKNGYTASDVYVVETRNNSSSSTPADDPSKHTVPGFTFETKDLSGFDMLASPNNMRSVHDHGSGDESATHGALGGTAPGALDGYSQSLAGNQNNGYVGTNLGKTWGNTISLGLNKNLINGPGADLYVTMKDIDGAGSSPNQIKSTSTIDKSMAIAFRVIDDGGDGSLDGWHLYNVNQTGSTSALPTNFQPAETGGAATNVLGAIDLSSLPFASGSNNDISGITTFMPDGIVIDRIILVNNNPGNAVWTGFLGIGATNANAFGFGELRDLDNADNDNDPFTGGEGLVGRYGTRYTNGQDGNQAWFLGLINVQEELPPSIVSPEPASAGLCAFGLIALPWVRCRRRR